VKRRSSWRSSGRPGEMVYLALSGGCHCSRCQVRSATRVRLTVTARTVHVAWERHSSRRAWLRLWRLLVVMVVVIAAIVIVLVDMSVLPGFLVLMRMLAIYDMRRHEMVQTA